MSQLKRYNGTSWENVGGSIAPKTTTTTSDTDTYSCNYVNSKLNDTGWVDMSSYVNTAYFAIRTGYNPMVRKIGNVVYWRGSLYCHTAPNAESATLMSGIPSQFLPNYEFSNSVITWYTNEKFSMYIAGSGIIEISHGANIIPQYDWAGIQLTNLSGYPVD